VSRLGFEPRTN